MIGTDSGEMKGTGSGETHTMGETIRMSSGLGAHPDLGPT